MFPLLFALTSALAGDGDTHATVSTLPNGLTVILEPQTRTDQVALYLKYRVGSRDERDGEHGCAHLFEHLMFEGSRNVPQNMFDTWLTAAGGENNAWTSDDETVYHMTFPAGALDLALFLESDRMGFLDAGLTQENLTNQQSVVLQERATGYAQPGGRQDDALSRILWPASHPYHVPVIGTVADIEGFSLDAVQRFWRHHYRPRNATLVLVGNFTPEAVLPVVAKWFGDVPDAGPAEPRTAPDAVPGRDAVRTGFITDDVEERTVQLAWPTVPRGHADEAALDLLSWVLDGGRGTRIADALYYKKSLVSDWYVAHWTYDLVSQFRVMATASETPTAKLIATVDREVTKIAKRAPSAAEVARARAATWSYIEDALESPASRAELILACWDRYGKPNCLADEKARYDAVTPEDVRRVAETYVAAHDPTVLYVVPQGTDTSTLGATPVELP